MQEYGAQATRDHETPTGTFADVTPAGETMDLFGPSGNLEGVWVFQPGERPFADLGNELTLVAPYAPDLEPLRAGIEERVRIAAGDDICAGDFSESGWGYLLSASDLMSSGYTPGTYIAFPGGGFEASEAPPVPAATRETIIAQYRQDLEAAYQELIREAGKFATEAYRARIRDSMLLDGDEGVYPEDIVGLTGEDGSVVYVYSTDLRNDPTDKGMTTLVTYVFDAPGTLLERVEGVRFYGAVAADLDQDGVDELITPEAIVGWTDGKLNLEALIRRADLNIC